MRAVRVEEFGTDKVQVRDLPDPVPGAGEVLVTTEAATINPADAAVVTGAAACRFPRGGVGLPALLPAASEAEIAVAALLGDDVIEAGNADG
jgi:NADPH:quinone reductase-like Zn-dependent oxidoreductase